MKLSGYRLEGLPDSGPSSAVPEITGATVTGKKLLVAGLTFDSGAKVFLNGTKQKKTSNDEADPTTMLIVKKAGKKISPGYTVTLQVRNSDNTLSNEFQFTGRLI